MLTSLSLGSSYLYEGAMVRRGARMGNFGLNTPLGESRAE